MPFHTAHRPHPAHPTLWSLAFPPGPEEPAFPTLHIQILLSSQAPGGVPHGLRDVLTAYLSLQQYLPALNFALFLVLTFF